MKNLLDLRFIIGSFFLIVGILLLIAAFTESLSIVSGVAIDRDCGILFIVFSLAMLAMWKWGGTEAEEE
jgi:hypothetical protein